MVELALLPLLVLFAYARGAILMAFDWPAFLDENGISYKHVGKREIEIACPLCTDREGHLSINLFGHGWKCWERPRDHKSRSAAKLVRLLIHCSWEHACSITNELPLTDDVMSQVRAYLDPKSVATPKRWLRMPPEFKELSHNIVPSSRPFFQYLHSRGFGPVAVEYIARRFDLRYCTRGDFKGRIIFPIRFEGQLQTWTGRTIYPAETLRYRTLGADEGALAPISHFLLSWDRLLKSDADTICLCEGPMDVAKVQALGRRNGIVATCFFTSTGSAQHIDLLHELLPRFKNRYLILDTGMIANSIELEQALYNLGVSMKTLQAKDPGEIRTTNELLKICR